MLGFGRRCVRQGRPLLLASSALAAALVAGAFAAVALGRPEAFALSNDEGVYLMWARLVRQGYELYRQVWCDQPPLVIWTLVAGFKVWGESVEAARAVAVVVTTVGLVAVAGVAWLAGGRWAAPLAALALALSPLVGWFGRAVMSDLPANSLAALAILLALVARRSAARYPAALLLAAAAGALYGASLLVKPVTVPVVVVFPVALRLWPPGRRSLELAAAWLAGGGAVLLAALAVVDLAPAFDQVAGTVLGARVEDSWQPVDNWQRGLDFLRHGHAGLVLLALVGLAWSIRHPAPARTVLALWAGVSLAAVGLHTPLYEHHLALVLFPLAALAGAGGARLSEAGRWRVAAGAGILLYAVTLPTAAPGLARSTTNRDADGWQMLADLKSVTAPGDWIITDNNMLAYRAGLRMPPYLVDAGGKRLRARPEPLETWVRQTAQWQPAAIVFTRSSQSRLADYLEWVDQTYRLTFRYSNRRRIWTPAPGGPWIALDRLPVGGGVSVVGYSFRRLAVPAGEDVHLSLLWSTDRLLVADYQVFVHLLDREGQVLVQHDGTPAEGRSPTTAWVPGEWVVDRHTLPLPLDAGGGQYRLVVGLYRPGAGRLGEVALPQPLVVVPAQPGADS